uniref:Macrophage-expressed gene 1 protein n=1 Tax=Salmo trutta TaxID=8032 RepID=A0A673ZAA2_SALTR
KGRRIIFLNLFLIEVTSDSAMALRCRTNLSALDQEVLSGEGWDNLRSMDMGRVMNFSYSQCQTTEDGVYLIPDEVFVIPQKFTDVVTSSEVISNWFEQHSSTSQSINVGVSFLPGLNAKFSTENQWVKTHQVQDRSVTNRAVARRNFLYTVQAQPDFTLDGRFVRQAEEIADAIENKAAYLSEKMVLGYGTHVITSINAGASLVQEDYLSASYVSTTDKFSVKALAGLNFSDKLKFDIGSNGAQETSDSLSYQGNITYFMVGHPSTRASTSHSTNFNFQANVEDNCCKGPATNLTFCEYPICQNLAQMNPDTGSYSCRDPYTHTLLRGEVLNQNNNKIECYDICNECNCLLRMFCDKCCDRVCVDVFHVRSTRIDSYWCSTNEVTPEPL